MLEPHVKKWIKIILLSNSLRNWIKIDGSVESPNEFAALLYLLYLDYKTNKNEGIDIMSEKTENEIERLSSLSDNEFQKLIDKLKFSNLKLFNQ